MALSHLSQNTDVDRRHKLERAIRNVEEAKAVLRLNRLILSDLMQEMFPGAAGEQGIQRALVDAELTGEPDARFTRRRASADR